MEHPLIEEAKRRYPEGALLNWPDYRYKSNNGYNLNFNIRFDSTKIYVKEGNLLHKVHGGSAYIIYRGSNSKWAVIVEPSLHKVLKEHLESITQAEFDQAWLRTEGEGVNSATVNEFMESLTKISIDLRPYKKTRIEVYKAISSERDFQDKAAIRKEKPDLRESFHLGDGIAAIEHNIQKAREAWYSGTVPYDSAMEYIRKVAGICVKLGEVYGMPKRTE
ncbi:hypothetical protein [Nafulsella turpanensis]|uniref:hypothetical protein n=1 Tax=Nafulsella turpanensis TaxID=1265690 RepID=UPI00034B5EFA|nr:hypothetical protein [Nafulsella turpanensis]